MTKCRLLIVDDNKNFLNQLEKTIVREHKPYAEERGIALSIEIAYSPDDLKELGGKTYDIILSDICLTNDDEEDPGNSTAIQWLETIKNTEPIIILLSAHIDDDNIVQSIMKKLTGIRIIPKNPISLWKLQLFSALDQFQSYSMPIRYMDRNLKEFVRKIKFKEGKEKRLTRKHMAILFADIRNFTELCDFFQEKQYTICEQMQEYFKSAGEIIYRHGGILDKFLGDGIMAEFVDESMDKTIHGNYLICALAATEELVFQFAQLKKNLNEELLNKRKTEEEAKNTIEKLNLGCGIYAGNIYFGMFGDKDQDYLTAMGHEVNMAQRLESAARFDSIPVEYQKVIFPDSEVTSINDEHEVAAIILLADVVANRLVINEQMKHYQQIPTISGKDISTRWHDKKLYIKSYNNNDINRNAYCRIITKESIDEQQRRKSEKMD